MTKSAMVPVSQLVPACARIEAEGHVGTGYLISPKRIATCKHVLREVSEGSAVLVRFEADHAPRMAIVERMHPHADAALLRLVEPIRDVRPLPLATRCATDVEWESYGYPKAAEKSGIRILGTVLLHQTKDKEEQPTIQLYSEMIGAGNATPLHGLSGSPVLVEGSVVGHLKRHIGDKDDKERAAFGVVYATPARYIIELIQQINDPSADLLGDPLMQRAAALGLPPTFPADLISLFEEKTNGFVGRNYVFERLEQFVSRESSGYFIIEGDPGMGKSAIVLELIKRKHCVCHFNLRSHGITTPAHFIENVCAQLISRFSLPYSGVRPEATRDGTFLHRLLAEASAKLGKEEKLIIAVDALDEVDESIATTANILYLPTTLPDGVFFVLTRRSMPLRLVSEARQETLDLRSFADDSGRDVREYICQALKRVGVQAWMVVQNVSERVFVETLAEKSENNFMYLRCVLADIEGGLYADLRISHLPSGLAGYYDDHWRRMGMLGKPLPRAKIKIIYVICEARRPVSRDLLSSFTSEDAITVQEALDEWRQFLHEDRTRAPTRYSVYHASFREFLHRKEIVLAAGVTIPDIHGLIAKSLLTELHDGGLIAASASSSGKHSGQ